MLNTQRMSYFIFGYFAGLVSTVLLILFFGSQIAHFLRITNIYVYLWYRKTRKFRLEVERKLKFKRAERFNHR